MLDAHHRHTVLVVTGGERVTSGELASLGASGEESVADGAMVIAADTGVGLALDLGLTVDLAVGDMDSVGADALARATASGAKVERHPADKDATDLELALDAAMRHEPDRVVVVGGHGGRLDHFLANALLLGSRSYARTELMALMGRARVTVVRERARLTGEPGDIVSLVPLHGAAEGVTTDGLLYPLDGEALTAGSTHGVSNELVHAEAHVAVADGVLLAVQPGVAGTHLASGLRPPPHLPSPSPPPPDPTRRDA